jgi:hypothetical protein
MHGPACIFWANLTPLSLKYDWEKANQTDPATDWEACKWRIHPPLLVVLGMFLTDA